MHRSHRVYRLNKQERVPEGENVWSNEPNTMIRCYGTSYVYKTSQHLVTAVQRV